MISTLSLSTDLPANAGNSGSVHKALHLPPVGMTPPSDLVESTKQRHDAWSERNYQLSIEGFWSHVIEHSSGCWLWNGAHDSNGYGRWGSPYWHEKIAHRVAWEMTQGRPSPRGMGLEIDHACHSENFDCPGGIDCLHRGCVNPTHLREIPLASNRVGRNQRLRRDFARRDRRSAEILEHLLDGPTEAAS